MELLFRTVFGTTLASQIPASDTIACMTYAGNKHPRVGRHQLPLLARASSLRAATVRTAECARCCRGFLQGVMDHDSLLTAKGRLRVYLGPHMVVVSNIICLETHIDCLARMKRGRT